MNSSLRLLSRFSPAPRSRLALLATLSGALTTSALVAQPAPTPLSTFASPAAADPVGKPKEEILELPAFVVSTQADKGYRAGNSVSATRIDTPIKDLPFAINAFTEQFIEDVGARELFDVVKFAPSLTSAGREFNAGNTRFNIRGFDQLAPQRNGFVGTAYVDTVNVQRVEVVKGPASILYGQIQPGGTVNVITKSPTTKPATALGAQLGTDHFQRATLDVNQPLLSETLLFRFNGSLEEGARHLDPAASRTWVIAPTVLWNIADRHSLKLDYQWFNRRENPPVFMKPNIRIAGLATAVAIGGDPNRTFTPIDYGFGSFYALPPDFNYVGRHDYRDSDFESFYAEYTAKLGAHWTARANYNWSKRAVKNKLTGIADARILPNGITVTSTGAGYTTPTAGSTVSRTADGVATIAGTYGSFSFNPADGSVSDNLTPGAWVMLPRRARIQEEFGQGNAYQGELAGRYDFAGVRWRPLFGAFRYDSTSRSRQRQLNDFYRPWNLRDPATWVDVPTPLALASPALTANGDYAVGLLPLSSSSVSWGRDTAYYTAQSLSAFDERLMLVGGVRYNEAESRGDNLLVEPDTTTTAGRNEAANNQWTAVSKTIYQGGGGLKLRRDLMAYASFSQSFSVDSRFLLFRGDQSSAAKPTTADGREVGLKSDLFGGRVSATLAYFEIQQSDRILNFSERVGSQSLTTQVQGAEDESKGWELETTLSPTDNFQVYLSYSDFDVTLTQVPAGLEALLGARPEASVKRLFNVWTRYTVAAGPAKGLWIGAGANYTGAKAQRVDNPLLTMPAYWLVDVTLGYDTKWAGRDLSLNLAWKNVTDEEYFPANQQRGSPSRVVASALVKF